MDQVLDLRPTSDWVDGPWLPLPLPLPPLRPPTAPHLGPGVDPQPEHRKARNRGPMAHGAHATTAAVRNCSAPPMWPPPPDGWRLSRVQVPIPCA